MDDWMMFLEQARFSIPTNELLRSYAKRPLDVHIAAHVYGVPPGCKVFHLHIYPFTKSATTSLLAPMR